MPPPPARISQLDGLRGFAILLVVIWHDVFGLIETTPGSPSAYAMRALSLTWAGVDLFFVLSGFLIGGILLDTRDSATFFTTFYIRRACRIFPLYYVTLLLFVVGAAFVPVAGSQRWQWWLFDSPARLWSYATYLQNFHMAQSGFGANWLAATWSLAVEEQFYLLMPFLIWCLSPAALTGLLLAAVVLTPLCRVALQLWLDPHGFAAYVLLPARWDSLFLGVLAAVAWRHSAQTSVRRAVPAIRIVLAVALIGVALLMLTGQNIGTWGMTSIGYTTLAACGLATVLLAMASDGGFVQRLFQIRWLVWLGTISYGVYLFHRPVTGLAHGLLLDQAPRIRSVVDAGVTALAWACTLVLAEASARWFERPIVNAGRRWARY